MFLFDYENLLGKTLKIETVFGGDPYQDLDSGFVICHFIVDDIHS